MDVISSVDNLSILLSLTILGVASASDLKKREVSDNVWLIYGPIGAALTALRLVMNPSTFITSLASILVTVILSLSLAKFSIFGGADAKAFICFALSLPLPPVSIESRIGYIQPFFPLTVLVLSFLSSSSMSFWFVFKNLRAYLVKGPSMFEGLNQEPWWRKAAAFITGYPVSRQELEEARFLFPLEKTVIESGKESRRFQLFSNELDRDKSVSQFLDSTKLEPTSQVWVTPGLPMLIFVLTGFMTTLAFGI